MYKPPSRMSLETELKKAEADVAYYESLLNSGRNSLAMGEANLETIRRAYERKANLPPLKKQQLGYTEEHLAEVKDVEAKLMSVVNGLRDSVRSYEASYNRAKDEVDKILRQMAPAAPAAPVPQTLYTQLQPATLPSSAAPSGVPSAPLVESKIILPTVQAGASAQLSESDIKLLSQVLSEALKSEHLTGPFGRISILEQLANLAQEIAFMYEGPEKSTFISHGMKLHELLDDIEFLTTIQGPPSKFKPSPILMNKVISPFLAGNRDIAGLLAIWSRDEDSKLRERLPIFINAMSQQRDYIKKLVILSDNQSRYLTGSLRRIANIFSEARPDKAVDMRNLFNIATSSTLAISNRIDEV